MNVNRRRFFGLFAAVPAIAAVKPNSVYSEQDRISVSFDSVIDQRMENVKLALENRYTIHRKLDGSAA